MKNKPAKIISYEVIKQDGACIRYRVVTDAGEMWLSEAAERNGLKSNTLLKRAAKWKNKVFLCHPDIFRKSRAPNGSPVWKKALVKNPKTGINARREDIPREMLTWKEKKAAKKRKIDEERAERDLEYHVKVRRHYGLPDRGWCKHAS